MGAIVGTADGEDLPGTTGDDVIFGFGGADVIAAGDGADTVYAGDGVDEVDGGEGDDLIFLSDDEAGFGGVGETATGGEGADEIHGSPFADALDGGADNDALSGGFGADDYTGGAGADAAYDVFGSDTYRYGAGDGDDFVIESSFYGQTDTLILSGGLTIADITASQVATPDASALGFDARELLPYAIRLDFAGGGSVTVGNTGPHGPEFGDLIIDDGADQVSLNAIREALNAPTSADQVIVQSKDAGEYSSGAGDDTFVSQFSSFTFAYGPGDGDDRIENLWAFNNVTFGAAVHITGGLTAADVTFTLAGDNLTDLVITLPSGETLTIVDQFHLGAPLVGGPYVTTPLVERIVFDDASEVTAEALMAQFAAGANGVLATFDGDDVIDDVLTNGVYAGGSGSDVYNFGEGSGNSTIVAGGAAPAVSPVNGETGAPTTFAALASSSTLNLAVNPGDVSVVFDDGDMVITLTATGETITIAGQQAVGGGYGVVPPAILASLPQAYLDALGPGGEITPAFWNMVALGGDGSTYAELFGASPIFTSGISSFTFVNGAVLNRNQMANLATNRSTAGADTLSTDSAGGVLDGGLGDDTLNGGDGDDAYVLALGTGDDTANDADGDDLVLFEGGITPNLVSFTRTGPDGEDLLIEVDGPHRSALLVQHQFSGQEIERFVFSSGAELSAADVRQIILENAASEGSDSIVGFSADDTIEGRGGNDTLRGEGGDDTLIGGEGWDTAVYAGAASDYVITPIEGGYQVADTRGGDGVDLLYGIDAFLFEDARDGGAPAPSTTTVGVNTAPTIPEAAVFDLVEDRALRLTTADLVALGLDPDGDVLTLESVFGASAGEVQLIGDEVVFTPGPDFSGAASFQFTLSDQGGESVTGQVQINYAAVNDAPRATGFEVAAGEDTPLVLNVADILSHASDPEGPMQVTAVGSAMNGAVALGAGVVTFTPDPDFNGEASFSVTIADADGAQTDVTVKVAVAPVVDATTAQSEAGFETDAGEALMIPFSTLLFNEQNPDGVELHVVNVGGAVGGSVDLLADAVLFTPSPGFAGAASFTYGVTGAGGVATASIQVLGGAGNAPPVLDDQVFSAPETANDATVLASVVASDPDASDALTYAILGGDPGGLFEIGAATGAITLAPGKVLDREALAQAVLTVTATDKAGASDSGQVTINVVDVDEFDVTSPADGDSAANKVAENAVIGTAVGVTAKAADADATLNAVTFALAAPGGPFAVHATTGVITVAGALDREAGATRTVDVKATSADGSSATTTFTIAIDDVDEFDVTAPADTNATANKVAENAVLGTVVGPSVATSNAGRGSTARAKSASSSSFAE